MTVFSCVGYLQTMKRLGYKMMKNDKPLAGDQARDHILRKAARQSLKQFAYHQLINLNNIYLLYFVFVLVILISYIKTFQFSC